MRARRKRRPHGCDLNQLINMMPQIKPIVMAYLMVALAVSTSALAVPETAAVMVYGQSFELLPSQPATISEIPNATVSFSTFNGTLGSFLIDVATGAVSGEFRPQSGAA